MAETADLRSIEVLRDVRAAVCNFTDEAKNALADVEMDIRRTLDWLQNEQRLFWQGEIKRWDQKLQMAKAELARKKMGRFLDHKPDTSQEEKALKIAKDRLEDANRKLELLRRVLPDLQHAVEEYRGASQPLASMVDVDLQRAVARLDRMSDALEAYLSLSAPSTPGVARDGGRSGGSDRGESMSRGDPAEAGEPAGTGDRADERQRGVEQAELGGADAPREVGPD